MQFIKTNKLLPLLVIFIVSIFLVIFNDLFKASLEKFLSEKSFLAAHNLLELTAVIFCFAIFLISYFSYYENSHLRTILIGSMLLSSGIMREFHLLSHKGMPDFLAVNTSSNRAVTLWAVSEFVFSIALVIGGNMSDRVKCTLRKGYFLIASVMLTFALFAIVTWYPVFLPEMYIEGYGITALLVVLELIIVLLFIFAAVSYFRIGKRNQDRISFNVSLGLIMGAFGEICFTIYPSIYDTGNLIGHVLQLCSIYITFKLAVVKNIRDPFIALTSAQKELRNYADNLDKTVEQRTSELKMMNSKLLEDLEYAREIQDSLLPMSLPDTKDISFVSVYLPIERISGDAYDVFQVDDRYIGFYVCDASGHGVPAAMLTVFLKQCIDNTVDADRRTGVVSMPSAMIHNAYDAFNHTNFKDDVYIVLVYCIYDIVQKRLTYSSAGMNVMPLLSGGEGDIREIEMKGFPICRLSEICAAEFDDHIIQVQSGDRLYLYTDGLPEAQNSSGEYYTNQRLKNIITRNSEKKLYDQCRVITDDFAEFRAGKKADDDVTILAVEFRG